MRLCLLLALVGCSNAAEPAERPDGFRVRGPTPGRPFGLAISAGGHVVTTYLDRAIVGRWGVGESEIADTTRVGPDPVDIAFTADGALAYVVSLDSSSVHVFDTRTGVPVDTFILGSKHGRILMHPDDSRFWVVGRKARKVWAVERASGAVLDSVELGDELRGITRLAGSGRLVVNGFGGTIWALDGNALDVVASVGIGGLTTDVISSASGDRVFVADESGARVVALDGNSLATVDELRFSRPMLLPFAMSLSPDGLTLAVSSAVTGHVMLVDAQDLILRRTIAVGGKPRRIAFRADGSLLYVANEGGWVDVLR